MLIGVKQYAYWIVIKVDYQLKNNNHMGRLRLFIPIIFMCLLTYSCNSFQTKTELIDTTSDSIQQSFSENILYPAESDTMLLDIQNGKATVMIHKQARQYINLKFFSGDYSKVTGVITSPDSMANIRFSQIVMPDDQMDGPFGKDITYDLPKKGDYLLLLHENQMAGDPWEGTFQVTLTLSKP